MEKNIVIDAIMKLSDEFHEMEKNGVEFTEKEDNAWADLTNIVISYTKNK